MKNIYEELLWGRTPPTMKNIYEELPMVQRYTEDERLAMKSVPSAIVYLANAIKWGTQKIASAFAEEGLHIDAHLNWDEAHLKHIAEALDGIANAIDTHGERD